MAKQRIRGRGRGSVSLDAYFVLEGLNYKIGSAFFFKQDLLGYILKNSLVVYTHELRHGHG